MPADVGMEHAAAVVSRQPGFDESSAFVALARLGEEMDIGMRAVRVLAPQLERACGDAAARGKLARFGVRPAEVREKPPVLPVLRCEAPAQREARSVVVRAAAEAVQAEGP